MNKKKLIAITGILLILGVIVFFKYIKRSTPTKEIHYHAGFIVFDNGRKVDFSDSKYMFIKPCKVDTKEEDSSSDQQMEKAHLHENVGDVVHVEAEGAKWGDLFTNINYPLDYSKVTAFINGTEVPDIKNTPIKAYDSLALFIGNVDKNLLSEAVTVDRIKTVESKSVECGN